MITRDFQVDTHLLRYQANIMDTHLLVFLKVF